jgi:hypothetical protein
VKRRWRLQNWNSILEISADKASCCALGPESTSERLVQNLKIVKNLAIVPLTHTYMKFEQVCCDFKNQTVTK